jgi:hypothetical protein
MTRQSGSSNSPIQVEAGTKSQTWAERRRRPTLLAALFMAATLTVACQPSGFRGTSKKTVPPDGTPSESDNPNALDATRGDGVIDEAESNSTNAFLQALLAAAGQLANSGAGSSPWGSVSSPSNSLQPRPASEVCKQELQQGQPIDIVFNLDVSTSMRETIATIKQNIRSFAESLGAQGIDARVGAVGYVDKPEVSIVPTDVSAFSARLATWTVMGDPANRDIQEGGQSGLGQSLYLLAELGRANALKAIIHISDAVSFAGTNPQDFTVDTMGTYLRAASAQMGSLLFFTSLPSSLATVGNQTPAPTLNFSPRQQMEDLRSAAGNLYGEALPFPFSASVMTSRLPSSLASQISVQCQR